MAAWQGKLSPEAFNEIKDAAPDVKNKTLAEKHKVTPQYISHIRRGRVHLLKERLPVAEVELKLIEIRGMSTMVQKKAQAADIAMDALLMDLEDCKRQPLSEKRTKRLHFLIRSLKDFNESDATVSGKGLGEMTDEEVRDALTKETS